MIGTHTYYRIYNSILSEFAYTQADTICMVGPSNGLYTAGCKIRLMLVFKTLRSGIAGLTRRYPISVILLISNKTQLRSVIGIIRTHL